MKDSPKMILWIAVVTVAIFMAGAVLSGALGIVEAVGVGGVFWLVVVAITIYKFFAKRSQ